MRSPSWSQIDLKLRCVYLQIPSSEREGCNFMELMILSCFIFTFHFIVWYFELSRFVYMYFVDFHFRHRYFLPIFVGMVIDLSDIF